MTTVIRQSVTLPAPPAALWTTYTDSARHAAAIGSSATVGRKVGGAFRAFDGMLRGRILALVPGRMVVQTWRGAGWRRSDLDSILVLTFGPARGGGRIDLVHANVPDRRAPGIRKGWPAYYWRPWKASLTSRKRSPKTARMTRSRVARRPNRRER